MNKVANEQVTVNEVGLKAAAEAVLQSETSKYAMNGTIVNEKVEAEEKLQDTEEEEEEEEEYEVVLTGQAVQLHGLSGEMTELNGRYGTVLEDYTGEGAATAMVRVRVNQAFFRVREIRLERRFMRVVDEDGKMGRVEVVWTYARRLNTGQHGGFGEVMGDAWAQDNDEESSVRTICCTEVELHEFVSRMRFDRELDMGLLQRLGLYVRGFANSEGVVGKGKDNVIASGLCAISSAAQVVGTAFFIRMHPETGKLVDFSFQECMRTMMYLNDLENMRREYGVTFTDFAWETVTKCFPYYDIGCRLSPNGFFGLRSMTREADGEFEMEPEDMEPAESFVIKDDGEEHDVDGDKDEDAAGDAALVQ